MRALASLVLVCGFALADDRLVQAFQQAVAALNSGDYSSAETGFQAVLRESPNHLPTLQNLGVVYSRTGRVREAIAIYQRALPLRPKDPGLLFNLGVAYVKAESYRDAVATFEELVEVEPGGSRLRDRDLLERLAGGYLKQNPSTEARASLERFLAAVPSATSDYFLGVALMADSNYEEAAAHLEHAIELDAGSWSSYFYLAKARMQLRQPEAAAALLQKAAGLNPKSPEVFYELGRALKAAGRAEEAKSAMQRVRELRALELKQDAEALRKQ